MNPNLAALPEGFSFHASGRCGSILYRKETRILELYWEMSGVPEYDILLWLEDVRTWTRPENEMIEPSEREQVVKELEAWLWKQKIRSDAFPNSARK